MGHARLTALAGSPITLSGSLSASGSTATVTGTARTVTVPTGNDGTIAFINIVSGGTGTLQYSKNGGAFTNIGANVVFANGDTLQIRATTLTSLESDTVDLQDKRTGSIIQSVTISRT